MKKEVLKVVGLKKSYGEKVAVKNLDLHLNQGEIFGLVGPNGAGKSTTIECIIGTKKRDGGTVQIIGKNLDSHREEIFEEVGVQFQASYYPDRIKVKEMCELTASLYKKDLNWKKMLNKVGLTDKSNQMVSDLSGGEKQKLSIVLALLHEPKVVFLDELTTGLDPLARREVWNFLKVLKERGLTIFLTSHYMDEVHHLCDRISIINHGQIIISGTPDELVQKSGKHNLEEAYIDYINKGGI